MSHIAALLCSACCNSHVLQQLRNLASKELDTAVLPRAQQLVCAGPLAFLRLVLGPGQDVELKLQVQLLTSISTSFMYVLCRMQVLFMRCRMLATPLALVAVHLIPVETAAVHIVPRWPGKDTFMQKCILLLTAQDYGPICLLSAITHCRSGS